MIEVGVNREWFGAQSSLKFLTIKFLRDPKTGKPLEWLDHYNDWYDIVLNAKRSSCETPRGHGKSVFWSYALPIWDVIRGKADFLLVSYSEDQVINLIRLIKSEIETNPFLAPIRPSTKEIWGANQLGFGDGGIVRGLGFGTSARGAHPKRLVGDDMLKDSGGMGSEDQERFWFGVISGMAMADTQIHAIGTPVHFLDLLMLLEKNPVYRHWKKPALNPDGTPLCPKLFDQKALAFKRQEMGPLNFAREFLLQRIDPATQPFKSEFQTDYTELPTNFARTVTVCDPAYTENDGDATAIVTVRFTHGNHAYVTEAKEVRREDPGEIINELFKTINTWEPESVGIEKRKGDAISYSFEERRTRDNRWDFAYIELHHGGLSKGNRMNQVGGLIPRWAARTVHVHPNQKNLLDQLYKFRFNDETKGHDDLVDALAYCFHPDMAQPNTGRRHVPLPATTRSGKAFYVCGSAQAPASRFDALANDLARIDRRIGEAA
jgi:hypothetical protein